MPKLISDTLYSWSTCECSALFTYLILGLASAPSRPRPIFARYQFRRLHPFQNRNMKPAEGSFQLFKIIFVHFSIDVQLRSSLPKGEIGALCVQNPKTRAARRFGICGPDFLASLPDLGGTLLLIFTSKLLDSRLIQTHVLSSVGLYIHYRLHTAKHSQRNRNHDRSCRWGEVLPGHRVTQGRGNKHPRTQGGSQRNAIYLQRSPLRLTHTV